MTEVPWYSEKNPNRKRDIDHRARELAWVTINELVNVLDQAEVARRWVPVTERLPEDGQRVLFFVPPDGHSSHQGIWSGRYFDEPMGFGFPGIGGLNASHWMPLPEPPKQGDGDE